MKMNKDLGYSYDDMPQPVGPGGDNKKMYPTFHYEGPEDLELPKDGTMTIKFKKTSSSEREGRDGKKTYSCTVEVKELVSVNGEKDNSPSKRDKSAEESLDRLASEKMRSKKSRNSVEDTEY